MVVKVVACCGSNDGDGLLLVFSLKFVSAKRFVYKIRATEHLMRRHIFTRPNIVKRIDFNSIGKVTLEWHRSPSTFVCVCVRVSTNCRQLSFGWIGNSATISIRLDISLRLLPNENGVVKTVSFPECETECVTN